MITLEDTTLFRQLQPDELGALRRVAREQRFKTGQEVFKEGDAGDGLYLVKEGLVEISALVTQGARQVFSQVSPGDMFGEMAVIEDKPRSAWAVARGETVVYFIPRAEMLDLVSRSPALALALLREISHRLRQFDRQYLREVLQAERLAVVGRFARSIVHDLKNPLNIIGLSAELASLEEAEPSQRRQAISNIRQQVERISEMTAEILEFTQGSAPDLVLPPMAYNQFVDPVIAELRAEAELRAAAIELETEAPVTALLLNPKRLRRVFYNLVHNATDAMPQGGKILFRFSASPGEIVTEIEDTGPGIAPEIADRLFEPFSTYGKAQGTGLGLSICKRIVEDHRGWIKARTEKGHGAIFVFGLPVPQAG
ncbi:MAG TPA: ATP-binding protein [Verrucomicrobiae bacterium]|nr:ATP-binding protein [Verrucomicrobiae bacterium]